MAVRFVVDNSVVMAWCFGDEESPYADAVLESLIDGEALAPSIWPLELGNALLAAERRKRLGEASVDSILALVDALPIRVEQDPPERMLREVFVLARENGLSTYDASYLDPAIRHGLPISTLDESLIRAAGKCRIPIFDPIDRR